MGCPFPSRAVPLDCLGRVLGLDQPCKFGLAHTCDKINSFGGPLWHSILRAPRMRLGRQYRKFTTHSLAKLMAHVPLVGCCTVRLYFILWLPTRGFILSSLKSILLQAQQWGDAGGIQEPTRSRRRKCPQKHGANSRCSGNPHAQELKLMDWHCHKTTRSHPGYSVDPISRNQNQQIVTETS